MPNTLVQILTLFGFPALFVAGVLYIVRSLKADRVKSAEEKKQERKNVQTLEKAVQALLRAQMINDYNRYTEKKFAPVYAKESFENVWTQYHALGANGVMDGIHAEFMALPTSKQEG